MTSFLSRGGRELHLLAFMRGSFGDSNAVINTNWGKWTSIGQFSSGSSISCSLNTPRSSKRIPSWTDRVLYATYTDSPESLSESNITNILYTSIPSYTTSDHVSSNSMPSWDLSNALLQKPIVCLLLLPSSKESASPSSTPPIIRLPENYSPAPDGRANLKRYIGRSLDRVVGLFWWLLVFLGAGSSAVGLFNFILSLGAWTLWKAKNGRKAQATV